MVWVELMNGGVAVIDGADAVLVEGYNWSRQPAGYAAAKVGRSTLLMHRLLLPDAEYVDHINGDRLDNRRENLRACSCSQNLANRGKNKNNTSGFKGVTWSKSSKKWQAQLKLGGKMKYLGVFDVPKDAALAYDRAAVLYFGEFAKTNGVEG